MFFAKCGAVYSLHSVSTFIFTLVFKENEVNESSGLINQSIKASIHQSINQGANQSINQWVNQTINQSVKLSIYLHVVKRCMIECRMLHQQISRKAIHVFKIYIKDTIGYILALSAGKKTHNRALPNKKIVKHSHVVSGPRMVIQQLQQSQYLRKKSRITAR